MEFFNRGKLPLSNTAMKVAARNLQQFADHAAAASIAIRAALREDAKNTYELWHRDKSKGRIGVDAPLTWVSGGCGSGKTELTYAAARHAARNGYRVVTITTENNHPFRWQKGDRVTVDLRESWPHSAEEITRQLMPQLSNAALINLIILCPVLMKSGVDAIPQMEQVRRLVIDALPRECFLVIDDPFSPYPMEPILPKLRSALGKTASMAIISSPYLPDAHSEVIAQGECLISMRMVEPYDCGFDHRNLREGMGYLHFNGEITAIEGDYEFDLDPAYVLSDQVRKAIERLEKILNTGETHTHMDRLEAVARACGYRSWHAAQGRSR